MNSFDFCIVGSGIVGLAAAYKLKQKCPNASIIILEKESECAAHQSSHNSGVIHSGIYYEPGSLKAELCKKGNFETISFCKKFNIPYEICGKLIVATSKQELDTLEILFARSKLNGIKVKKLSVSQLFKLEPEILGYGALLVKSTGITDYKKISDKLEKILISEHCKFLYGFNVNKIKEHSGYVKISNGKKTIKAKKLIVCAGLQADRLAKMAGFKVDFKIIPFKGEYYELPKNKKLIFKHHIYPVPNPSLPFLGIHFTKMIDGSFTVGPNAILAFDREGYSRYSLNFLDVYSYVKFKGFWNFLRKNICNVFVELKTSLFKFYYLKTCRKYYSNLKINDLSSYSVGIRAQVVERDGSLANDFKFLESKNMLHVCNAPSPAATSAFPIADFILERLFAID
jgi:L-2-hydroxyglutarate oxidase